MKRILWISPAIFLAWMSTAHAADLKLQPDSTCLGQDDQLVVEVLLQNNTDEVTGATLYLGYSDRLSLVGIEPGDTPFTVEVDETIDTQLREVTYEIAVPDNVPPAGYTGSGPIAIARLTFDLAAEDCSVDDAVSWRDPGPPLETELTILVGGVPAPLSPGQLLGLETLRIDLSDPTITCPASVVQQIQGAYCEELVTVGAPVVDDNCGVASVTNDFTGTADASGTYPVGLNHVAWTVTDTCGNTSECSMDVSVRAFDNSVFNFEFEGDQVVPPSGSTRFARGIATLNGPETEIEFVVQHGVMDPVSVAVHRGDVGTNGPVVYSFSSPNSVVLGTWALSPQDLSDLRDGLLYVQINSSTYPNGDIRGQIAPKPEPEPGDVIITEIMYHPASLDQSPAVAEWIEVFNTTFADINLGGWYFQDEDTTELDPCTLRSSGTIPCVLLQAGELAVLLPDGGAPPAAVADFKTAWNLTAAQDVFKLNADGTADGAITYKNLEDTPYSDGNDGNDLPLVVEPCDPENPTPHSDNEVLTLNSTSSMIDAVNYDDAAPWPQPKEWWPNCNWSRSVTLVPADYPDNDDTSTFTGDGNDEGIFWELHEHGDVAGGRMQVTSAGVYGGRDIGSPCYLYGATPGNQAPTANPDSMVLAPHDIVNITLGGADETRPFFNLLLFVIRSIPENGLLIHLPSGYVVTAEDVAGSGFLVPTTPFNTFRYVNDGTCGVDGFQFQTYDAQIRSPIVTMDLYVQCGDVAITEVMFDPDSTEDTFSLPEWVELYNTTQSPIDLAGWYFEDDEGRSGDLPSYVLGASETVVVIPAASNPAEFLQAWGVSAIQPTTTGDTAYGAISGYSLAPCHDELRLIKPGGPPKQVVDAVFYDTDGAWPDPPHAGPSIYLDPPTPQYDAYTNDEASLWSSSVDGVDLAYENAVTSIYDGLDVGSPGGLKGVCGDGVCESSEDQCDCPADCGTPPANETVGLDCLDMVDNDCDGSPDCVDDDCYAELDCVQACCLLDQSCMETDPGTCIAQGGVVRGRDTVCEGDSNGNNRDDACETIPTLSEWGLMLLAGTLLVGGAVLVRRRAII